MHDAGVESSSRGIVTATKLAASSISAKTRDSGLSAPQSPGAVPTDGAVTSRCILCCHADINTINPF